MKAKTLGIVLLLLMLIGGTTACASKDSSGKQVNDAADAKKALRNAARASLESLYASTPQARELQKKSVAILVFPDILRAGLIVGASGGKGVLFSPGGEVMGYYEAASLSFGLQAGAQDYSQAFFLMTPAAFEYLDSSNGWSIGVGPTVVVMDKGMAGDLSTTTLRSDVYTFIYGQEGLMAGVGLSGEKITKIEP